MMHKLTNGHRRIGPMLAAIVFAFAPPELSAQGPDDVEAGARNFRSFCVACHGGEGGGGHAPDLSVTPARNGMSDDALFATISNGRPARGMPGWDWIPEIERRQLVAYIRSIDSGRSEEPLAGDAARGARLFTSKGGCRACHMVNGVGGTVGPDLSLIGRGRSPTYLRRAMIEPNADLDPLWWSVRVVDEAGTAFEGRRMSEDTYTIRMLDLDGVLRAFDKASVERFENVEVSVMPRYDGILSPSEIDDIVAYLYSLRGD